jgi:hypothetical protein
MEVIQILLVVVEEDLVVQELLEEHLAVLVVLVYQLV